MTTMLSLYNETGRRDACNVFTPSDLPTVADVDEALDEGREFWIEVNREDAEAEGLRVEDAYAAWRAGWRAQAVEMLTARDARNRGGPDDEA